jgi:hypothetical protein
MTDPDDRPDRSPRAPRATSEKPDPGRSDAREARLAAALRANLRRRKAGASKEP